MIAYVKGKVAFLSPTTAYIDCNGVAYLLHISLNTFSKIEGREETLLYTHLHVTENSQTLYGFAEEAEKEIFIHLISVSGVGPSTARLIVSSLDVQSIQHAILSEDELLFKKVKGIGTKTAKQIILDLKNKISRVESANLGPLVSTSNRIFEEALSALVSLGFQKNRVQKVLEKLMKNGEDLDVEDLVRKGLAALA